MKHTTKEEPHDVYLSTKGHESASTLKKIIISDKHYLWYRNNPTEQTSAMKMGTAIHKRLLEADDFKNEYAVLRKEDLPNPDKDFRNAENKAYKESLDKSGKVILTEEEWGLVDILAEQSFSDQEVAHLLNGGISEQSVYFKDDMFGIDCKMRFDKVQPDLHYLIDVKTTQSAEPEAFVREIINRDYDLQMMFYADNLMPLYGVLEPIILAVEKQPPYNVIPYTLPMELKERGRNRYSTALNRVNNLRLTNAPNKYNFEDYETIDGIVTLKSPKWIN